jgi:hypothetical protein
MCHFRAQIRGSSSLCSLSDRYYRLPILAPEKPCQLLDTFLLSGSVGYGITPIDKLNLG